MLKTMKPLAIDSHIEMKASLPVGLSSTGLFMALWLRWKTNTSNNLSGIRFNLFGYHRQEIYRNSLDFRVTYQYRLAYLCSP